MDDQGVLGVVLQSGSSRGTAKHPLHDDSDIGEVQWFVVCTLCHDTDSNHVGETYPNIMNKQE